MIELYHNDMSVCAQKVRFALGEKALQWKSRHLNLRAGDQQKPEYVKLNPNAVVPTLVDGGNVIIESTVICEYLDDAYPEPSLSPRNPVERARMRLWTKQLDESVHAATRTISNAIAFRHQKLAPRHRGLDGAARQNSRLEEARRELGKCPQGRRFFLFCRCRAACSKSWCPTWNRDVERVALAGGKQFSLADIGYAPYILRLKDLQLQFLWDQNDPISRAWFEKGRRAARLQNRIRRLAQQNPMQC